MPKKRTYDRVSEETKKALLKAFEAGKGNIPAAEKHRLSIEHGMSVKKITTWIQGRRRIHGVYGEKLLISHLTKFWSKHPGQPFPQKLLDECTDVMICWLEMHYPIGPVDLDEMLRNIPPEHLHLFQGPRPVPVDK